MADLATARMEAVLARLERHVIPEPMSGCHLWIGSTTGGGYGSTRIDRKNVRVHRAVWELAMGSIPDGKMVLHSCDNRACVNILHLHIGDHVSNMREMASRGRGSTQKRTRCPRGHAYSQENTLWKESRGRRWRACHECHLEADRERWRHNPERATRRNELRRARRLAARGGRS